MITNAIQPILFHLLPTLGVSEVVADAVKTGTGGIDAPKKSRNVVKPTGLTRKKKGIIEPAIETVIAETHEAAKEIAAELAKEFTEESSIPLIALSVMDDEIGMLLRKKQKIEEEEIMLMILLAASA